MRYYEAVKRYREETGNVDIHADYVTEDGLRLGVWVSSQRYAKSKNKLPAEQIELLDQVGFCWQRDDSRWSVGYSYAEAYYRVYGNLNVIARYVTADGFELGTWITAQRVRRKQGKLSDAKIAKLDGLQICWDPNEAMWLEGYDRLKRYAAAHGTTQIAPTYTEPDGYKLGAWLANKKMMYKKGTLTPARVRMMEELGVVWSADEERWQTGYEHALRYYHANGHLNVPQGYASPDGYKLFNWVAGVKKALKERKLSEAKIAQLSGLGIEKTSGERMKRELPNLRQENRSVAV